MKKYNYLLLLFVLINSLSACLFTGKIFANAEGAKKTKIYISKVIDHPALDATTKGIIDGLKEGGFIANENLDLQVKSAQGSATLAAQIASKFINNKPDIVVGVATLSAQSLSKYPVRLIFSTVTDPQKANLIKKNVSGVSNFISLAPQLELFKNIKPNLKRLGILYNSGELNSVSLVTMLEKACPEFDITLVKQTARNSADVVQAAIKLAENCDAIFISNDNTALSALPAIIKVAGGARIPVFVSDIDAVEQGAAAALGPNQYQIGKQTAAMIVRILKGADINEEKIEYPETTELYINLKALKKIGIIVPAEIIKKATKVID